MGVRAFFSSPRRRRRTIKLGLLLLSALGLALLFAFDRNTVPQEKQSFSSTPATVYKDIPQVRLNRPDYFKARDVAVAFIQTAVARKHLERSCALVSRQMMQGMTCRQWQTQDIPVVPYQADETQSKYLFDYSYKNSVGMKVALFPQPGSHLRPSVFHVQLTRNGRHGRWLVDEWQPAGVSAPLAGGGSLPSNTGSPLGATWLLVPAAIFFSLLFIPVAVGLREWRRRRRADRAFPPSPLPPLRGSRY
jgi:hypothetical protein